MRVNKHNSKISMSSLLRHWPLACHYGNSGQKVSTMTTVMVTAVVLPPQK